MDFTIVKKIAGQQQPFFFEHFTEIDSTSRYLCTNAEQLPEYHVVVADKQTAGRGRLKRHWESPDGMGLWFSILLRPGLPLNKLQLVSLFSGNVLIQAIEEILVLKNLHNFSPRLKWPNDLLINGQKVAGILLNGSIQGSKLDFLVLGIGINLTQEKNDFPPSITTKATSLKLITGQYWQKEVLLGHFLRIFNDQYPEFLKKPAQVIENFTSKALYLGSEIEVLDNNIKKRGIFTGINPDGHLILQQGSEETMITNGELIDISW